jgi:hypothetical protein
LYLILQRANKHVILRISGVFENRKEDISETGSGEGGGTYSFGPVRKS